MWLGVVYNLREWIKSKNGQSSAAVDGAENGTAAVVEDEIEMRGGDTPLERTSTAGSSSSSVFQTVGLRKQATKLLRRANRPKTYSAS